MTPQIRNGIAVFSPQGFLDGNNAPTLIMKEDINFMTKLKVRGVIVSFKKVVFFNKNGLTFLVDILLRIQKEKDIEVGFFDYKPEIYKQIMHFFKGTPEIHLFQSQRVLDLFIDGKKEEEEKLLLYAATSDQRGIMLMKLKERGISDVSIAKDKDELRGKLSEINFDVVIDSSYLALFTSKMPFYTKGNAVIYSVEGYIDGEIANSFNYDYHLNSLAVGFKVFIFNCENVNSLNTHGVNFFNKLAVNSAEYGANLCICGLNLSKTPEILLETLQSGGIFFEESIESALKNEELNEEDDGAVNKKGLKTISKKLVKELPIFVDSTVETIEVMTGANSEKAGATIGECHIENGDNMICSSVGFFGDIEGVLFLFFPRDIAKKACLLLLGEDSKDLNEELDALSELINIVAGKVKADLINKKEISIQNTLPRTYDNIKKPTSVINNRKGVFVKMLFDKEPFYFFLTR